MHLNTLFPEARLKNTLEMRGADAQPGELLCALPALWKGVLDDPQALQHAHALIASLDVRAVQQARPEIARLGLGATLAGKSVQRWASELLEIAEAGLARFAIKNASGQDESIHLARITKLVAAGQTPAQQLLAKLDAGADFRHDVIRAARL